MDTGKACLARTEAAIFHSETWKCYETELEVIDIAPLLQVRWVRCVTRQPFLPGPGLFWMRWCCQQVGYIVAGAAHRGWTSSLANQIGVLRLVLLVGADGGVYPIVGHPTHITQKTRFMWETSSLWSMKVGRAEGVQANTTRAQSYTVTWHR